MFPELTALIEECAETERTESIREYRALEAHRLLRYHDKNRDQRLAAMSRRHAAKRETAIQAMRDRRKRAKA